MIRLLMAFPLALLACYLLVGLMAWMVDLNSKSIEEQSDALAFNFFAIEQEQTSERKNRLLPDQPEVKPEEPEPVSAPQQVTPTSMATPAMESMPDVNLDLAVTGLSIAVPSMPVVAPDPVAEPVPTPVQAVTPNTVGQNQQIMPLHRAEPVYPRRALQRRIEGYVIASFDIDKGGRPINIKIVEGKPARVFDREAIKALKRWKYQPKLVNGNAVVQGGQKVKLEFKLN